MRPVYEKKKDRDKQYRLAEWYAEKMGASVNHCDTFNSWDFVLHRNGQLIERGEIKCRQYPREAFQTYMLSLDKYQNMIEGAKDKVPLSLVVEFMDGVYRCYLPPAMVGYGKGGRKDRGDEKDIEEVVFIPLTLFGNLGERHE